MYALFSYKPVKLVLFDLSSHTGIYYNAVFGDGVVDYISVLRKWIESEFLEFKHDINYKYDLNT